MLFSCLEWSSNERTVGWSEGKLLGGAGSGGGNGYEFPYSILRMCWTGYQEDLYHYLHTLRRYCAPTEKKTGVQYKYRRLQRTGAQHWSPTHVLLMLMMIAEWSSWRCWSDDGNLHFARCVWMSVCEYCRYVWHSMSIRHRHRRMSSNAANKQYPVLLWLLLLFLDFMLLYVQRILKLQPLADSMNDSVKGEANQIWPSSFCGVA